MRSIQISIENWRKLVWGSLIISYIPIENERKSIWDGLTPNLNWFLFRFHSKAKRKLVWGSLLLFTSHLKTFEFTRLLCRFELKMKGNLPDFYFQISIAMKGYQSGAAWDQIRLVSIQIWIENKRKMVWGSMIYLQISIGNERTAEDRVRLISIQIWIEDTRKFVGGGLNSIRTSFQNKRKLVGDSLTPNLIGFYWDLNWNERKLAWGSLISV